MPAELYLHRGARPFEVISTLIRQSCKQVGLAPALHVPQAKEGSHALMNNLHARHLKVVSGLGLITAVMIVAWMVKPGAYRPMLVTNADAAYAITSFAAWHESHIFEGDRHARKIQLITTCRRTTAKDPVSAMEFQYAPRHLGSLDLVYAL